MLSVAQSTAEYADMRKIRMSTRRDRTQPKGGSGQGGRARFDNRARHDIVQARGCNACYACGRVARLDLPQHVQNNIWRGPCVPRPAHAKVLAQGHAPVLQAKPTFRLRAWACSRCHWTSNNMLDHACHARQARQVPGREERSVKHQLMGQGGPRSQRLRPRV